MLLPALAVAVVAAALYAPTLGYGFVVDDHHQIVNNPQVRDWSYAPRVFSEGVWDFQGRRSSYFRPAMYVSYMAVYSLAGPRPAAYHALNVALHAITAAVVVLLGAALLGGDGRPGLRWGPFAAGLVFATHPIHTEPVAWVAGLADVGSGLFYLLSLTLYVTARERATLRPALAGACFLVALLFKEPAATLPGVLIVHDLARRSGSSPARWVRRLLPFAVAAAIYALLRFRALGGVAPTAVDLGLDPRSYAWNVLALLAGYAGKLLAPIGLNFYHHYRPAHSLLDPRVLAGVGVIVLLLAAFVFVWSRRRSLAILLVLLALPLAPAFFLGGLNQGIENAFTERYLYLPSAGLALLTGAALRALCSRGAWPSRIGLSLLLVVTLAFTIGTLRRLPVWNSDLTLWTDVVERSPGSAVAHQEVGFALIYAGRQEEGERELRRAVEIDRTVVDRKIRKGVALSAKGLTKDAMLTFHAALALDPRSAEAHYNLGVLSESLGATQRAAWHYRRAIDLRPDDVGSRNNLAILLAGDGRLAEAIDVLEEAARLAPGDAEVRGNLARARELAAREDAP